ncbi:hypothetical protein MBLNU459_g2020t1 [Dothideomycetes sp. NU459]
MLKAPLKQTASDTIATLSSRLSSATLLEDRRASILGLRSFAKQYPASVASGSLRDLIGCLRTDGLGLGREGAGGDVDTVRIVLETLLMLFNPDQESPEASEDIALWLADEFSQRQDNITILLDLLDQPDYYARMYSIQLLTAVSTARPERTQECILQAPLGTARLVAVLDDGREAVRNAALLLLVDLTNVSQTELQKLIAFEDAFQRTFNMIKSEGGLAEGDIVVQDCLSLIANLIRHSASNQSLFRESGCIPRLVDLVNQTVPAPEEDDFTRANRERNSWGLLAVLRLFLDRGEVGTKQNQDVFWKSGLLQMVLRLSFDHTAAPPIRTSALKACADIIIFNPPLQENFAALQVPAAVDTHQMTNGAQKGRKTVYVIEALLDLVLSASPSRTLELRSAGCALIKAYFSGHQRIKHHFLQRAIGGYTEGEEETVNALSTLMNGPRGPGTNDPMRYAFASQITCQLLFEEPEAKKMLMSVSEGDAEKGEDVITAVQTVSAHLLSCLQDDLDPQISIAYLTLLITFLFDDPAAINDCLAEGSALVGALMTAASQSRNSQISSDPLKSLLPGLGAILLGTIYEFSTKDSPIPRRTLHPLLISKLGRQRYFDALSQFRQHPTIRDAEILADAGAPETDIADPMFVDWFKDEYGRLRRAIDRDPGIEVIRRTDVGVDRDVLDELREQIKAKDAQMQQMEQDSLAAQQRMDQIEGEHRRDMQSLQSSQRSMEGEVDRVRRINEQLQREHDVELQRVQGELRSQLAQAQLEHRNTTESTQQQHARELDRLKGQQGASLASERSLWEDKARKAAEQATREQKMALARAAEDHSRASEEAAEEHRKALEALNASIRERDSAIAQRESTIQEHQATIADKDRAERIAKQEHQSTTAALDKLKEEHLAARKSNEQLDKELQRTKGLQADVQQVNTKAMARIKTLEEEGKQRESRVKNLTEERDKAQAETSELRQKMTELEQDLEGLKSELAAERKGYGELETELNELKEAKGSSTAAGDAEAMAKLERDVSTMKAEAEKERAEAKKARAELEDMLMVLSDLEGKTETYRERLKKLGEEVSEDEEDEDEDDEEEEDEGEDGEVD